MTSHSVPVFAVLLISYVGRSLTSCPCFRVKTTDTIVDELIHNGPLYSQAASVSSLHVSLDSVCLGLAGTRVPNNAVVEMIITFKDKTVFSRAGIKTTIEPGTFLFIGPSRTNKDFILGEPCDGTYVFYRCIQTGSCVDDISKVDVFIASKQKHARPHCIKEGIDIAQKNFPELEFYELPRTAPDPCYPEIPVL